MADHPNGLGTALKARRHERGLTLAVLAERVGCARSYLSAIENGRRGAPSRNLIERLESALDLAPGSLQSRAEWEKTPAKVRADVVKLRAKHTATESASRQLAAILSSGRLDDAHRSGELRTLVDRLQPDSGRTNGHAIGGTLGHRVSEALPVEVPLINKVAAGYPADFTDLGYPARMADEYVRVPDLADPDAFAARVVGDSMEPEYREGDIVVFSPARDINDGCDCFARLEPDHESTFKRVYFEVGDHGEELIRLQPMNNRYAPRTVERERVAGLYRAVSVTRSL
ncbi:MAG: S24 family peptidase [Planctomycetota bacterium]